MTVKDCIILIYARLLFWWNIIIHRKWNLLSWKWKLMNKKTVLGECDYDESVLYLSSFYIKRQLFSEIRETILHEVAHALEPSGFHDLSWKNTFIAIGGKGNTYAMTHRNIFKYKTICSRCIFARYYHIKSRIHCPLCGSSVKYIDNSCFIK